jgi:hypothetical protein
MNIAYLLLLSAAVVASQWTVEREVDPFTDEARVTAIAAGEQGQVVMQAQCSKGDILVIFTTNGLALSSGSPRRTEAMIRADDRLAVRLSGAGVQSNLALSRSIHADFAALWTEMRSTKEKLLVRVISPTGRVAEDRLTGKNMQTALEQVALACPK